MSTIPKKVINAAIKYGDRIGNDCDEWLEENDKIDHYALAKNGFLAGYQLASKTIDELKDKLEYLTIEKLGYDELKKEIASLEAEKERLKKENEMIKNHYRMEVIRRNMIIEKLAKTGAMLMNGDKEAQEKEWVSFQKTYNL